MKATQLAGLATLALVALTSCGDGGPSREEVEAAVREAGGPNPITCSLEPQELRSVEVLQIGERREMMGQAYWPAKVHTTGVCSPDTGDAYKSLFFPEREWDREDEYWISEDGFGGWEASPQ